ncbi:MAG: hypothetical protein WC061_02770 [Melioribacteraceae bacterium]
MINNFLTERDYEIEKIFVDVNTPDFHFGGITFSSEVRPSLS